MSWFSRKWRGSVQLKSGDDYRQTQVQTSIELMGYTVRAGAIVKGISVPLLAERSDLLVTDQIAIGCRLEHVDALIGSVGEFANLVFVIDGPVPEATAKQERHIRVVALADLENSAGPEQAQNKLRRAAFEWKIMGAGAISMTWQEFERISAFRRKLRDRLDRSTMAFALRCSIQHGKNLPFWSNVNRNNNECLDFILQPILQQHGRRPFLRAGYALEKLTERLRRAAIQRIEGSSGFVVAREPGSALRSGSRWR